VTWTYNKLQDKEREWAKQNKQPFGEKCIRVVGGKKMAKSAVDKVAGNGRFGFSTRRGKKDDSSVSLVKGLDEQWKSGRKSIARRRKNVCKMMTTQGIKSMEMDGCDKYEKFVEQAVASEEKRIIVNRARRETRRVNRNPKARRGHARRKTKNFNS
jgi:hypothetical protein